jgi:hypothetical protein
VALTFVQELLNVRKDLRFGDDGCWVASGVDVDVDGGTKRVPSVDHMEEVQGLDGLGEPPHTLLLSIRHPRHRLDGVEHDVGVPNVGIVVVPQISAKGRTPPVERTDQHLRNKAGVGRIEVVGLATQNAHHRDISVL